MDQLAAFFDASCLASFVEEVIVEGDGRAHASFVASIDAPCNAGSAFHPVAEEAFVRGAEGGDGD